MQRWIHETTALGTIALALMSTLGCSMGANPHDCKYAAYGGLIDRVDRVNGRVGSVLDPAVVVTHAEAASVDPEPTPAAEDLPEQTQPQDLPEPREAELDDGRDLIHVEQDGSTLELMETHNTHDESLYR